MSSPTTVTATLNYFTPPKDGSKPYTDINVDTSSGRRGQNWETEPHEVEIENIRGTEEEGQFTLDNAGFQVFRGYPLTYTAFASEEEIVREYYPESVELVKRLTGASRVEPFDHTIRRRDPTQPDDSPSTRQPVTWVHVDQTASSAVSRVHRHLPASLVPSLLTHRFQIINLWRPITHPAWDFPLAFCDFRSVDVQEDLVPTDLVYPERKGETLSVKFNPRHRWKYSKGMRPDEFVR